MRCVGRPLCASDRGRRGTSSGIATAHVPGLRWRGGGLGTNMVYRIWIPQYRLPALQSRSRWSVAALSRGEQEGSLLANLAHA